jgi:hypothetical protein
MKILQTPISPNHTSPMFFDGVIATEGNSSLVTFQDGELVYNDKLYIGREIIKLSYFINDVDIDEEVSVDIHVDKFFAIKHNDVVLEDYVYNNYDVAISEFTNFLKNS